MEEKTAEHFGYRCVYYLEAPHGNLMGMVLVNPQSLVVISLWKALGCAWEPALQGSPIIKRDEARDISMRLIVYDLDRADVYPSAWLP